MAGRRPLMLAQRTKDDYLGGTFLLNLELYAQKSEKVSPQTVERWIRGTGTYYYRKLRARRAGE